MLPKLFVGAILCAVCLFLPIAARGQRGKGQTPRICGDPTVRCRTIATFEPHQLPFQISSWNSPIFETEWFFAVVLKSIKVKDDDCQTFVPETERLEAQQQFPRNKVFTDRCFDPGELYYEGFNANVRFMAIYAKTRADATKILAEVKKEYPLAFIRRTRTGFNGT
jgi:hypothetical protein